MGVDAVVVCSMEVACRQTQKSETGQREAVIKLEPLEEWVQKRAAKIKDLRVNLCEVLLSMFSLRGTHNSLSSSI